MNDPLARTPWSDPRTVAGFVDSPPNETLMRYAAAALAAGSTRLLDIGCGAGRNAIPLAQQGWRVAGVDLSLPMLHAAMQRAGREAAGCALGVALSAMEHLPIVSGSMDLIVAQGIWNLARSTAQFRRAVQEASRVARPGAGLFVFTFSRATLPADAEPVQGEAFVFTGFSGTPQVFLTMEQLNAELAAVGFVPDPAVALAEHNRRAGLGLRAGGPPVILEGAFRHA
jgi:SAM-dependent methyltransferase